MYSNDYRQSKVYGAWASFFYWLPRMTSIIFTLWISLFALDVFGAYASALETLAALGIHLIPTFLLVLILALSWHHDLAGTIAYAVLSIVYVVAIRPEMMEEYVFIVTPLLLISGFFLIEFFFKASVLHHMR